MKIIHFYHFDSDPRFPPFLLYVRWKSGVTVALRCFRDGNKSKGVKKGRYSGGISVYYKNCLNDKIKIIVEKHQCGIIWVKLLQDVFIFEQDVYVCHSYIPPMGSKVLYNDEIDMCEIIEQGIARYKNLGKLYVTGDLNSRTSNELDLLDFDKYLEDEDFMMISLPMKYYEE